MSDGPDCWATTTGPARQEGGPAAAEALCRDALALALAIRLMCRSDPHPAKTHARNAVRTAPADPQSHTVMAMVFTEAMKPHAAEGYHRRALALMGRRDPMVLSNHALSLRMQGRLDEARPLYAEFTAFDTGRAADGSAGSDVYPGLPATGMFR